MRMAKYRAWHKTQKKMQQVLGIELDPEFGGVFVWGRSYHDADTVDYDADKDFWGWSDCELMQYAGLEDKNGKGICEGDIIKTSGDIKPLAILFEDGAFMIDTLGYYMNKPLISQWDIEVIGNIYEHPELVR